MTTLRRLHRLLFTRKVHCCPGSLSCRLDYLLGCSNTYICDKHEGRITGE